MRDAELVRAQLIGDRPWTVLGQSFGGFCCLTYLSLSPEGLAGALITGGLPSLTATRRRRLPGRLPAGAGEEPRDTSSATPATPSSPAGSPTTWKSTRSGMPSGERLSVRRFQTLGITFGGTGTVRQPALPAGGGVHRRAGRPGAVRHVPARGGRRPCRSRTVRCTPCCTSRSTRRARPSGWAAERVRAEFPEFDASGAGPLLFTGEMIYPWQFDEDPALVPLREAADLLARRDDWPALYDVDRLADNDRPGRRRRLCRRHVRRPRPLAADRRRGVRAAHLGDQRIRARRATAGFGRPGSADRDVERHGMTTAIVSPPPAERLRAARPARRPAAARRPAGDDDALTGAGGIPRRPGAPSPALSVPVARVAPWT